jgi:hypothetical protein
MSDGVASMFQRSFASESATNCIIITETGLEGVPSPLLFCMLVHCTQDAV